MDQDNLILNENEKTKNFLETTYTVTISPHIHERIETHIHFLKRIIDRSVTKQRWITTAIREKLEKDENNNVPPKATTLNVKIDKDLSQKLVNRVEFIKKFRVTYSKKKLILDAVLEKLERDEKEAEKKIMSLKNSTEPPNRDQLIDQLLAKIEELRAYR